MKYYLSRSEISLECYDSLQIGKFTLVIGPFGLLERTIQEIRQLERFKATKFLFCPERFFFSAQYDIIVSGFVRFVRQNVSVCIVTQSYEFVRTLNLYVLNSAIPPPFREELLPESFLDEFLAPDELSINCLEFGDSDDFAHLLPRFVQIPVTKRGIPLEKLFDTSYVDDVYSEMKEIFDHL